MAGLLFVAVTCISVPIIIPNLFLDTKIPNLNPFSSLLRKDFSSDSNFCFETLVISNFNFGSCHK